MTTKSFECKSPVEKGRTYSTGDMFLVNGGVCVLAQIDYSGIAFVNLVTGNRLTDPVKVRDIDEVSIEDTVECAGGEEVPVYLSELNITYKTENV